MNVVVEELGSCQKKLTIQLSIEEVSKEFRTVVQDLRKNVTLPGFRKGKASVSTIKRRFRRQINDQVKENLLETSLKDALLEQELNPVGSPSIDVKSIKVSENQPVEYVAEVEFWPSIEVDDYKGVEITRTKAPETSEEQITEALEALRRQNAIHEPVDDDHVIVDNDSVTVNYQRTLDGEAFGEAVENVSFWLGVEQVLPELAENVFGKKKGDHVDFSVQHGEDAPDKSLAGKTLDFSVDIDNVENVVLPELDDEFAKDLEQESLESLKERISQNIQHRVEQGLVAETKNRLLLKIAEGYDFEVPPSLVKDQKKASPDKEDDEILKMLQAGIVLAKIQNKEDMTVTDEEIDAAIENMAMQQQVSVAAMRSFLSNQGNGLEQLRSNIGESKALDFLYEHANVVEEE